MSEYQNLIPKSAQSTMRISADADQKRLYFSNIITYFYIDMQNHEKWPSYKDFLKDLENYEKEISINWENLQGFLDQEENIINGNEVNLHIINTEIHFIDKTYPYIQWVIEFEGRLIEGLNKYENFIEKETLQYPIYSLYLFEKPLKVTAVDTSLNFVIGLDSYMIEYYGNKGDALNGYESISFTY